MNYIRFKKAYYLFKKNVKSLWLGCCLLTGLLVSETSFADVTLYHIVSQKELITLTKNNIYTPEKFAEEGYIHFSKLSLIVPIANEAYRDKDVLFLLEVTFSDDNDNLKWIGDNPDYYLGLDLSMVTQKYEFTRNTNNQWVMPKTLLTD
jgi:uncharacterized protein (DUF952 family)